MNWKEEPEPPKGWSQEVLQYWRREDIALQPGRWEDGSSEQVPF